MCEFAPLAINKQAASLIGFVEIQSPGGEEQATGMKLKIKLVSKEAQERLIHM